MNYRQFKNILNYHFKIKWRKTTPNKYEGALDGLYKGLFVDYYAYNEESYLDEWFLADKHDDLLVGTASHREVRFLVKFLKRLR